MNRPTGPLLRPSLVAFLLAALAGPTLASGGGAGPRTAQDPQTDLADVFAFVGTRFDDPAQEVLNVLVQVRPFAQAGSGSAFPRFADDAVYSIHLVHPVTAEPFMRYDFHFSDVAPTHRLENADSILSYGRGTETGPILTIGDARQNYVQTYRVECDQAGATSTLGQGLVVPPPNVGKRTTPFYNDAVTGRAVSGAASLAELDPYTAAAIHDLPDGEAVFAGTREDGFYGDLSGILDLLDPRILGGGNGQAGGGPDAFAGATVLCYAIQIPLRRLSSAPFTDVLGNPSTGVGVYASASRRLRDRHGLLVGPRPQQQVSRMGNPLLGQLLLPLRHKDFYQRNAPTVDAALDGALRTPELAELFNGILGTAFAETNRSDLVALYLPDVLRVDTTTGPTRLPGQVGFQRLSSFAGDTVGGRPGGWPNGRRPGDDVVDILFTFLASGPTLGITSVYGDNVHANDQLFNRVFPYLGTPPSGTQQP